MHGPAHLLKDMPLEGKLYGAELPTAPLLENPTCFKEAGADPSNDKLFEPKLN